MGASDIIFFF